MTMSTTSPTPTPTLDALVASGAITIEDGSYVGHASDGVAVAIGVTFRADLAERYLTDFPTPDRW